MSDFIMLKNVRVSFPHLFSRPYVNGEEGKCGATLMLEPKENSEAIQLIQEQIDELVNAKFKGRSVASDRLCLRAGEDKGRSEYQGYLVLSANSKGRPLVISNDGRTLITSQEDCPIYAGCYVNAKIRLWSQNKHYGKRINAELIALQFAKHGEPLDGAYVSVEEAMAGFGDITQESEDLLAA